MGNQGKNTYVYTYSSRRSPKAGTKRERERRRRLSSIGRQPIGLATWRHAVWRMRYSVQFSSGWEGGGGKKRRWKWAISEWETTVKKGKNIYLRNKKFPDRITWFKTSQMSFTCFFAYSNCRFFYECKYLIRSITPRVGIPGGRNRFYTSSAHTERKARGVVQNRKKRDVGVDEINLALKENW